MSTSTISGVPCPPIPRVCTISETFGFGEMRSTADSPGFNMLTTFFKSFSDKRLAGPLWGARALAESPHSPVARLALRLRCRWSGWPHGSVGTAGLIVNLHLAGLVLHKDGVGLDQVVGLLVHVSA